MLVHCNVRVWLTWGENANYRILTSGVKRNATFVRKAEQSVVAKCAEVVTLLRMAVCNGFLRIVRKPCQNVPLWNRINIGSGHRDLVRQKGVVF